MKRDEDGDAPGDHPDLPWDARIRQLIDFGIDESLIDENLRRTPTERLRRLEDMLRFLDENRPREPAR